MTVGKVRGGGGGKRKKRKQWEGWAPFDQRAQRARWRKNTAALSGTTDKFGNPQARSNKDNGKATEIAGRY